MLNRNSVRRNINRSHVFVLIAYFDSICWFPLDCLQAMHIAAAVETNSRLLPHLHGLHEALVQKVTIFYTEGCC